MNCSVVYCSGKGVKRCECGNIRKEFCQVHYDEHMKDKSISDHNPRLSTTLKSSSEVILNYLLLIKSESDAYRRDFYESIFKIHESLRIKSQNILKEFLAFSSEIDLLINNIKNENYNISEGCLAKCLKMSVPQAIEKTKSWKLISNDLNIEPLLKAVSELKCLNNNLHSLYFEDTPEEAKPVAKPASRNPGKSNEPASKPDIRRLTAPLPAPPRPANNKLYCRNNHQLVFDNLIFYKYWINKKSLIITCDSCNEKVTDATWNCQQCNFDVCCSCAKNHNQQVPTLKCLSGHSLVWRCDFDVSEEKNFKCNGCNSKKPSFSRWNCKQCNYNKCIECGKKCGYEPALSVPKCSNNHILNQDQIIFNEANIKFCNRCGIPIIGEALVCTSCNEQYCAECTKDISFPLAAHPIAACGEGHILIKHIQTYTCSYCKSSGNFGFACVPCNYKICLKCCNFLIEIITKPIKKSINGSPLEWNPRCNELNLMMNLRCTMCGEGFGKNGFFRSSAGNKCVCLMCFIDPERMKRNQIEINRNGADIMNLLMMSQALDPNPRNSIFRNL